LRIDNISNLHLLKKGTNVPSTVTSYEIWQNEKPVSHVSDYLGVSSSQPSAMKRIICFLFAVAVCRNITTGQVLIAVLFGKKLNTGKLEFGLVVTPQLTGISNIIAERRDGLCLGIYFNIRPDRKFFIHAEGIAKGAFGAEKLIPYPTGSDSLDQLFSTGTVERKIKAFSMPVLVRYTVTTKFFLEAGIQPNMMLSAKDFFRADVNGSELEYTNKISEQVTLLDFGMAAGLHYKFRNDKRSMGVGVRFYQGFTDILSETNGKQVNTAWQFVFTIPIGVGKSSADNTK